MAPTHLGKHLGSRVLASDYRYSLYSPSVEGFSVQAVDHLVSRRLEHPEALADPGAGKAIESQLMDILAHALEPIESGKGPATVRGDG